MSETIEGNTIRAEEISYDFNLHRWTVSYNINGTLFPILRIREVGPEATLQEVFNILIQTLKERK